MKESHSGCLGVIYYLGKELSINSRCCFSTGGSNPGVPQTDNVDILDTASGTWQSVSSLPVARSAPGCILTTIGGEEGVLLSGGFNTAMGEHLYDTLFYSLSSGTWKEVNFEIKRNL